MRAQSEMREAAKETATRDDELDRWLAVSEPLAVDDDAQWKDSLEELWDCEPAA